jgi:hypothetical protein
MSNTMEEILKNVDIKQSLMVNDYIMDSTKFENKQKSRVEFGLLGGPQTSHVKSNMIDVENDLFGITRDFNKCPSFQYAPPENKKLEPIKYIKCHNTPTLNLEQQHLRSINFFDYQEVPKEPSMIFDKCQGADFRK